MDGGKTYTVDQLFKKILRSKSYFEASGGGVTVSGGEPLLQLEFVTELFRRLQELNIHTALDTAGSIPINSKIKNLLKYTNLVLLDIKHIDNEKSIDLVGTSNKNNLSFAKYLSDNRIPMWIRQVLVPGYTDDEQDLLKLKAFISNLNSVKKVEILPYHSLGKFKWEKLRVQISFRRSKTSN